MVWVWFGLESFVFLQFFDCGLGFVYGIAIGCYVGFRIPIYS